MAGTAGRIALQVLLALRLGLPEIADRRHFCHDLAGPDPLSVDIVDGILGDALLLVVFIEDGRAVARADIVALTVTRRRIKLVLAGSNTISIASAWLP
jgi:hypothetical protein